MISKIKINVPKMINRTRNLHCEVHIDYAVKKGQQFQNLFIFFHLELTIGHPYKHIYLTYDSFQTLSLNYMHKAKSFVQKEKTKSDFYLKTPNNWLLCITWSWSFSEPGNSCAILPRYYSRVPPLNTCMLDCFIYLDM